MDNFIEVEDQIFALHLQSKGHVNGQPNENCPFCKNFIIDDRPLAKEYPLESYSFLLLDVS